MCLCFSPATKIRFSRVEANVYLLGGGGGVNHFFLNILQNVEKSKLG